MPLLLSSGERDHFFIDLEDEVVRGSIVLHEGRLMWPPPPPKEVPATAPVAAAAAAKVAPKERNYFAETGRTAGMFSAGLGTALWLGHTSPTPAFASMVTTFR